MKYYFFLMASMAFVGFNMTLGKMILQEFSLFHFSIIRFGFVAILFSWGIKSHLKEFYRLSIIEKWNLFLMAFVGFFGFTLFMLLGLKYSRAIEAGVLTSLIPLFGVIFSVLFLKEKLKPKIYISLILAMLGVSVLNYQRTSEQNFQIQMGHVFIFLAIICESAYVIFSRKLSQKLTNAAMTFWMSLFSTVLFLLLNLFQVEEFESGNFNFKIIFMIIIYSLFGSVFAVQLWMNGARHLEAHKASLMTSMVPVFACLSAILLLDEALTLKALIASAIIFLAIGVVTYVPTSRNFFK